MDITTPATGITRDITVPVIGATRAGAIAWTSPENIESNLWKKLIDQLLAWRSASEVEAGDELPVREIVDLAIDFASAQIKDGDSVSCAPDSMVPSGAGRIAMEWNDENGTRILEFVQPGTAALTTFGRDGRISAKLALKLDPAGRQLERRG